MVRKILGVFYVFAIVQSLFAQTPFIRNFTPQDYKMSGQNWSIIQDQRGVMYFANNQGVLEYDGIHWRSISTPTRARSLCIGKNGVIYVGLETDFGYLLPDSKGKLVYTSLKDKIPIEHQEVKQVWSIFPLKNEIVFVAANKLYIHHDDHIEVVVSDMGFKNEFVVNNQLYIQKKNGSLWIYQNEVLHRLNTGHELNNATIKEMLPYKDNEILLATFHQGLFIYNPDTPLQIRKPKGFETIDNYLIKNDIYCGAMLYNDHIAIATNTDGIITFDKSGKIDAFYNHHNGLQSNSVYYLFTDSNQQLWVALENGISHIMNNLPFTYYSDKDGLDGSVYCAQRFEDRFYVGTSDYLYVQKDDGNFKSIAGTSGQNYYLYQANGVLLSGNHSVGLHQVKNGSIVQPTDYKNLGGSIAFLRLHAFPQYIIAQVLNSRLALLEYTNETWTFRHFIEGFHKNTRYMVDDDQGNLWIQAENKLYKLRLNKSLDRVNSIQEFTGEDFKLANAFILPYRINEGEVIFSTDKGVYRYQAEGNYFEPHPDFSMFTGGAFHMRQAQGSQEIWFEEYLDNGTNEKGVLQLVNGKYEIYKTPFYKFTDRSCTNAYSLNPISDSIVFFGTNMGLLEYHPKQKVDYDIPFNTLIREVYAKDSLLYGGTALETPAPSNNPITIAFHNSDMIFNYAATFYEESEKNRFSYRLLGSADTSWSSWTTDHKKEYSSLYEGEYVFEVRAQNIYRKTGRKAVFAFTILPPWQRTWLAYLLYAVFAVFIVWLFVRLNSLRLKKHNELLKQIVKERTENILKQKNDLEKQAHELAAKNSKLHELNATKDKFFSIISHDLRSPFNSILGYTDLLLDDYDEFEDEQRREIIYSLSKSSRSAFELLENLLTWSRAQTGRIEIHKEKNNLKELVECSIAPYMGNASKKNITITLYVSPEKSVLIDRNTAQTIIGNLVNNAIKFTPEGGKIKIEYKEKDKDYELHIIDTGVGMTNETINKLFKIEEHTTTKGTNNEKGTGLGLMLCNEFVTKNGGTITVISEKGKGSDFILTFPKNNDM